MLFTQNRLEKNIKVQIFSLTDVSKKEFFNFPDDGPVIDGLNGDLQHGVFLSVGWEGVGKLKLESPTGHPTAASDPLTRF